MSVRSIRPQIFLGLLFVLCVSAGPLAAQTVTYLPYIQPGDNGPFGPTDQMIVTWQTDESAPVGSAYLIEFGKSPAHMTSSVTPSARVVDNYLAADPQFSALTLPFKYGAHADYTAVLRDLAYNTRYFYRVTGPGLPAGGFSASFHTRKTGDRFVFQVQGDEGYYPGIPNSTPPLVAIFEGRIINTMFNVSALSLPGQHRLPPPDFALNTGDNIYVTGGDGNYRDMWMKNWNSDVASNDIGAPFLRSIPLYIVAGNHDVGSTGATANLLADSGATVPGAFGPGPFGGGLGGGDALAYFNNFYYPLNGPEGADIQFRFHGNASAPSNFFFSFNGTSYNSFTAVEALRASTAVDAGKGVTRQIDHMSNYSFDYGNAHFVFLDANPHLFDNLLPGGPPGTAQTFPFPPYPTLLRDWLINDLDSSHQAWKVIVMHQPAISSGNATISNDQMRTAMKIFEDHGANLVFHGHEHNYQRSLPLRALPNLPSAPTPGVPQVDADTTFDGSRHTVPDGVLYFVEGAGGNRDFDDNLPNPRGNGTGIDQEDSTTGTTTMTVNNSPVTFAQGVPAFMDTALTDDAMKVFLPNAGTGPKITARFKAKVFSFAHIVVDGGEMTMYQITEPLTKSSSATPANPAPFGTDINGKPLNDPIPDTVFDPVSKTVVSSSGTGTPALLDKITITKPDISDDVELRLTAPRVVAPGGILELRFAFENRSRFALNGTQAVITLPEGVSFESVDTGTASVHGRQVVVTLGRTSAGHTISVGIKGRVENGIGDDRRLVSEATLRSATALPVEAEKAVTKITAGGDDGDR